MSCSFVNLNGYDRQKQGTALDTVFPLLMLYLRNSLTALDGTGEKHIKDDTFSNSMSRNISIIGARTGSMFWALTRRRRFKFV